MKTIAINLALFSLGVGTGYIIHPETPDSTTAAATVTASISSLQTTSNEHHYEQNQPNNAVTPKTQAIETAAELPQPCNEFIDDTVKLLIENRENGQRLSLPEDCEEHSDLVLNTIQDAVFNRTQTRVESNSGNSNAAQRQPENSRPKIELSPEQQAIHDEWQAEQKEHISQVLSSIAPEQLANRMSRRIGRRSPFLNDVEYKVDAYDDEAWAYEQEQLLYSIISGHPNSAEFTLSSLSCHQMMCEIIGISTTVSGWNRIFQTIRQEAPGYKSQTRGQGRPASLRFTDPELDQSYVYSVLQFEAAVQEGVIE